MDLGPDIKISKELRERTQKILIKSYEDYLREEKKKGIKLWD